jgi:hypothetical protein
MNRYLLWLLLGLGVGGCAAKNTVAGSDKTKAEELASSLPNWCKSTCDRLQACPASACDCTGDTCSCTGVDENCSSQCAREMARFTASDSCASAGEKFKKCIDTLTCDDLNSSNPCELSSADKKACPETDSSIDDSSASPTTSVGDVPPSGAGGATGTNGSPGVAGVTGTGGATGAPPLVSCNGAYGTAGASSGRPSTSSAVICEEGRDSCNDGRDYSWVCARGSEGQLGCTCFVDSEVTGGFDPGTDSCPSLATVNAGCNWNIQG